MEEVRKDDTMMKHDQMVTVLMGAQLQSPQRPRKARGTSTLFRLDTIITRCQSAISKLFVPDVKVPC